jgi:hypothetical protein
VATLVALSLCLDHDGQIFAFFPVDFLAFGVIIDEIATVASLLLIEIRLCQNLVCEEVVLTKLEFDSEARDVEVGKSDVSEMTQHFLVLGRDQVGNNNHILHRRQPKLGNALGSSSSGSSSLRLFLVLALAGGRHFSVLLFSLESSFHFGVLWLRDTVDDLGSSFVQRTVLLQILLFQFQDFLLEFEFEFGVFGLETLEAG